MNRQIIRTKPNFTYENASGGRYIAGVDEVGRGAIAGPVVAAAVILDQRYGWGELNDSKKLTAEKRKRLARYVSQYALAIGTGVVSSTAVDLHGIVKATDLAMQFAVEKLYIRPNHILVDGTRYPFTTAGQNIIHGDSLSYSIAAASIIAKVTRDGLMVDFAGLYPGYGFEKHKGYATKEHLAALCQLGFSPIHRRSFRTDRTVKGDECPLTFKQSYDILPLIN